MEGKKKKKGGKKKGGKKGGKKEKNKGGPLTYESPPLVGPVGDAETERAFAELVYYGIIKIPKPCTFDQIVTAEQFFTQAQADTVFMRN